MLLEWNPAMSIGVKLIDEEHQRLVGFINELYEAIDFNKGNVAVAQVLNNTIAYCVCHFKHEEELFLQTDFPEKTAHIQEHQRIKSELADINREFMNTKDNLRPMKFVMFLKVWLIEHIQEADAKYVPYLHSYKKM
jgi:hemerythrin